MTTQTYDCSRKKALFTPLILCQIKIMLTDQHKQIILATAPLLREGGVTLTKHFYNRMFTYHPELKNLFNMGNQHSGKQQTALAIAVLVYAETFPIRLF